MATSFWPEHGLTHTGVSAYINDALKVAYELQHTHPDVGVAVSSQLLDFIVKETRYRDAVRHTEIAFDGDFMATLYGFDVYLIEDHSVGMWIAPIVLEERFGRGIRYPKGVLVVMGGNVYQSTDYSGEHGLIATEYSVDMRRKRLSPYRKYVSWGRTARHWFEPVSMEVKFKSKDAMSAAIDAFKNVRDPEQEQDFEPSPELDELLASMARKTE